MSKRKTALITGVTGQDGSYLAEFLLSKGYDVHGCIRRSSTDYRERIDHIEGNPDFHLHYADLSDSVSLVKLIGEVKPDEIYNLAAQSHVQVSFDVPEYTANVDALGVLRILEAVRLCGLADTCRIYQASTSELFGRVEEVPQRETTPFHPYSPYAVAKQYGYWIIREYRDAYHMFCCNGILFNHESERRGETFVTRKITLAASRIKYGLQEKLYLGNLSSRRDWGYAKDYIECMWLILQSGEPDDYVIATGEQHTVREFALLAFHDVGIELEFTGEGPDEKGIDKATGRTLIEVSPDYYRPTDVVNLLGDPTKAKAKLGWNPQKTSFEELVKIMADSDLRKAEAEALGFGGLLRGKGSVQTPDERIEDQMMEKDAKIYVAGHRGMVGSAIKRELERQGYTNIITRTHKELDLTRQDAVEDFFAQEKPEYVFLAAAKVGGIVANEEALADFMYDNMILEMNVVHSAWQNGCKKLEFLGSSCIYPRMAPQPMKESCLLTGPLEKTNEAYALAKISGLKYCEFLNRQYGTDYISVMPTNLYGPNDNYHPTHSHVLPAFIRRFHEAKEQNLPYVTCWGDGSPLREFLYVDDLANLCVFLMNNYSGNETVNAGTGKELTIKELTEKVAKIIGYTGEIRWDPSKPNGTPRKLLDISKTKAMGWEAKTSLDEGIRLTYQDFLTNPMRAER